MNNSWTKPLIGVKNVENLRNSIKVGDKITLRPSMERVKVIEKFPHLIRIQNKREPYWRIRTITYREILFNNRGLTYSGGEQDE